jgi:hypothetical protein
LRHGFAILTIPPYGGIILRKPPNTWGDVKGDIPMYRFLLMIAFTAIIGFGLMAVASEPGKFSFAEMELVAQTFMITGIALTLFGFVAIARSSPKDTAFYQHFVIAGLIVAAFGLCVFPFSDLKVIAVPLVAAVSAGIAVVIPKMTTPKHDGMRGRPTFIAMISGPASMWALAVGWNILPAAILLGIGLVVAFYLGQLKPVDQAAFRAQPADPTGAAAGL